MKKIIALLMAIGMTISLNACGDKDDSSQVANNTKVVTNTEDRFIETTVDEGHDWWYQYQKRLDKAYSDMGWTVLRPGVYIDPITHQIDVWGGDTGIFYNVAMPGVYDTDVWEIYYTDYNYNELFVRYDTDEFFEVQDRAATAWEYYKNNGKFDMSEDSYNVWYWMDVSGVYDVWAWTQKYQR